MKLEKKFVSWYINIVLVWDVIKTSIGSVSKILVLDPTHLGNPQLKSKIYAWCIYMLPLLVHVGINFRAGRF